MSIVVETQGDSILVRTRDHQLRVSARGGRIMEYAVGGANVLSLWGDYVQQGSTFWLAPQQQWSVVWPPDHALDEAPYEVSIAGSVVTLVSPVIEPFGVRIRKRFEMSADGSLQLDYGVRATGTPVTWSPWEVTRLRPGLCFFATGRYPKPIVDPVIEAVQPHVQGDVTWVPFATGNDRFRTLLADAAGWCGYAHAGLLLVKRFPTVEGLEFAPHNGSLKVWWQNSDFIELEQIGAYRTIGSGTETVYRTQWSLSRLGADIEIAPGSASLRALLP